MTMKETISYTSNTLRIFLYMLLHRIEFKYNNHRFLRIPILYTYINAENLKKNNVFFGIILLTRLLDF